MLIFHFDLILLSADIEVNPGPVTRIKACPKCHVLVHIRKLVCKCGHIFRKSKNACVSIASCPKCHLPINETLCCGYSLLDIQTQKRKQQGKDRISAKRALQTPEEQEDYRKYDRLAKKTLESEDQALNRKMHN